MQIRNFLIALFCCMASFSYADMQTLAVKNLGVQGALTTNGNVSIGIVNITQQHEMGLTLSGNTNNASGHSWLINVALFGGCRKPILNSENTYFAYGLNLSNSFGAVSGLNLNPDIFIAPYISLQQRFTPHVSLSTWINPYGFEYKKLSGSSSSTHSFFSTGGIAINYLFG